MKKASTGGIQVKGHMRAGKAVRAYVRSGSAGHGKVKGKFSSLVEEAKRKQKQNPLTSIISGETKIRAKNRIVYGRGYDSPSKDKPDKNGRVRRFRTT